MMPSLALLTARPGQAAPSPATRARVRRDHGGRWVVEASSLPAALRAANEAALGDRYQTEALARGAIQDMEKRLSKVRSLEGRCP